MTESSSQVNSPLSLSERLSELIRREGPITFHDWMSRALYDPVDGYYKRAGLNRWGREGDYRTSPERSELFAATFARYFASLYDELDRPAEWTIFEAGAGDAKFASGVLRTLNNYFPEVFAATRYLIDEVSSDSIQRAETALEAFAGRFDFCNLQDLPALSCAIVFSNELFDAFPVHRLTRLDGTLSEYYVDTDAEGKFIWSIGVVSDPKLVEFCRSHEITLREGQSIELNLEIERWLTQVSDKLQRGYLITVDYGAEAVDLYGSPERQQGTLRGYSHHTFVDHILSSPGDYDLTTTIDWTLVRETGKRLGLEVVDFARQDQFLLQAGVLDELQRRLDVSRSDAEKLALTTSAREMILPGGMASSFQVLIQKRGKE